MSARAAPLGSGVVAGEGLCSRRRVTRSPPGFRHAASSGMLAGAGTDAWLKLLLGMPASLACELPRLAAQVFGCGYVDAMRWTMLLVALAAVSALAIRPAFGSAPDTAMVTSPDPAGSAAS